MCATKRLCDSVTEGLCDRGPVHGYLSFSRGGVS